MPPFVACPACSCAVKYSDVACPHCGEAVRAADGSIARTAIAIVLGLSAVSALSGCGSPPAPKYGVPATDGPTPTTTVGSPEPEPPNTVPESAPKYGVPSTPEPSPPEVRPLYGVAGTPERN